MKKKTSCFYSQQIDDLQRLLRSKTQNFSQLLQETEVLREREQALQLCLGQMSFGIQAGRELMMPSQSQEVQQQINFMITTALLEKVKQIQLARAAATETDCSASVHQDNDPTTSDSLVTVYQQQSDRTHSSFAGLSHPLQLEQQQQQQQECEQLDADYSYQQQLLQEGCSVLYVLAELELHIQTALLQGRCKQAAVGSDSYTTIIIKQLMNNKQRTETLSKMTTQQLLASRRQAVKQYGLLLPRYDSEMLDTLGWNAKQQLDQLVDAQAEITLVRGLIGRPLLDVSLLMTNIETGKQQAYPGGWWKQVIEVLGLTRHQAASLKWLWAFSKPSVDQILTEYQQLSMRLVQLLQQQLQTQQLFDLWSQQAFCSDAEQQALFGPWFAPRKDIIAARPAAQQPNHLLALQSDMMRQYSNTKDFSLRLLQGSNKLPAGTASASLMAAAAAGDADGLTSGQSAEAGYPPIIWNLSDLVAAAPQTSLSQQIALIAGLQTEQQQTQQQQQQPGGRHSLQGQQGLGGRIRTADTAASEVPKAKQQDTEGCNDSPSQVLELLLSNSELSFEPWCLEQEEIEEQMTDLMHKLSVLLFMHEMQMMNVLTRKQLALAALHTYPYCLDAFSVCQTLDEMNWLTAATEHCEVQD